MKTMDQTNGLFVNDTLQTAEVLRVVRSSKVARASGKHRDLMLRRGDGGTCVAIPPTITVEVHYPQDLMTFYGTTGVPFPKTVSMSHVYCFHDVAQLARTATAPGYPDQTHPLVLCPGHENVLFYNQLIPQHNVVRYGILVLTETGPVNIVAMREWDFYGKDPGPDCLDVIQNIEKYNAALIFEYGAL